MSQKKIEEFQRERDRLNRTVMRYAGLGIKRFYNLDEQVYRSGALPAKNKEMLGLVASLVLRCDDCIAYHLVRCHKEGLTAEELEEVLAIGLVIGGSIVIPHLRRAWQLWDELGRETVGKKKKKNR